MTSKTSQTRRKRSSSEIEQQQIDAEIELLNSISPQSWVKISVWGKDGGEISERQRSVALTISSRVRQNATLSEQGRNVGTTKFEKVLELAPELLGEDDYVKEEKAAAVVPEIDIALIEKIVQWDKRNRRLKPVEYIFVNKLATGELSLTDRNRTIARMNLEKAIKSRFKE